MKYLAGIELGGTTCVAAISSLKEPDIMKERQDFDTTEPASTLKNLVDYFKRALVKLKIEHFEAIGIASFGPVDLHRSSSTYGHITSTPKPGWQYIDIAGVFERAFGENCPVVFETDTNAPVSGEVMAANFPASSNVVYVTVGTGVGAGVYVNGSPVHGLLHPEAGHMIVGRKPGDVFPGSCVFHKDCVEGMVNSKALAARANVQPSELTSLPDSHPVWDTAGYYLGALCVNLTYTVSPDVILFGGGVMQRKVIYDSCRKAFKDLIGGYLDVEKFKTDKGLTEYIRPSKFGNNAGIIGALLLANAAVKN